MEYSSSSTYSQKLSHSMYYSSFPPLPIPKKCQKECSLCFFERSYESHKTWPNLVPKHFASHNKSHIHTFCTFLHQTHGKHILWKINIFPVLLLREFTSTVHFRICFCLPDDLIHGVLPNQEMELPMLTSLNSTLVKFFAWQQNFHDFVCQAR